MSSTFDLLVKKIANIDNNIFSQEYNNNNNNNNIWLIDKIYLNMLLSNHKNKFLFLQEVINNFYYKNNLKKTNDFIFLFNKIQKNYHILNRLIIRYKYKKSKIIVNTDLQFNFINENDKNIICIFHNNLKYLFKINDIFKLIYTSLTNSHLFFSQPLSIKNPYNNLPFGKSILYYIYYFMTNNITISLIKNEYIDVFLKFKECNFNMTKFVNKHEHIIRDYSIKNYINNSTKQVLSIEIYEMIKNFNITKKNNKKIIIDKDFPNNELIKIMTPYLYLKILGECSLVNLVKRNSQAILNKKLIQFQIFNPKFGRKIIKINYKFKNGKKIPCGLSRDFIRNSIQFNKYDINYFMNNHLSYKNNNNNLFLNNHDSDSDSDSEDNNNEGIISINYLRPQSIIGRIVGDNPTTIIDSINRNNVNQNNNDTVNY
jgi:hypothetical protein